MARAFLREPLIHFVVAGLILFGLNQLFFEQPSKVGAGTIVVDQAAVVQFIQHRQNRSPEDALAQWQRLSQSAQSKVVKDFVEEEALYRKAKTFGLDEADYVIRRRMVQKMDFAAAGLTETEFTPSASAMTDYYKAHQAQFSMPAQITFTHVYYESQASGQTTTLELAAENLKQLNAAKVSFSEGGQYGQRFAYHRNYVDRAEPLIVDHFGADFAARVFQLSATQDVWQGPVPSRHGIHLVLIAAVTPERVLGFSEVKTKVVMALRLAEQDKRRVAFMDALLAEYSVAIEPGLGVVQ